MWHVQQDGDQLSHPRLVASSLWPELEPLERPSGSSSLLWAFCCIWLGINKTSNTPNPAAPGLSRLQKFQREVCAPEPFRAWCRRLSALCLVPRWSRLTSAVGAWVPARRRRAPQLASAGPEAARQELLRPHSLEPRARRLSPRCV